MKTWIYVPAGPEYWNLKIKVQQELLGHRLGEINGKNAIWPERVDKKIVCPDIFEKLKVRFNLRRVLIIDKILGSSEPVFIKDHVNRSGYNYLSGCTPFKKYPTFPDVSKIYDLPNEIKGSVVISIGQARFRRFKGGTVDAFICEAVGLVAPVWKYVDVCVQAMGSPKVSFDNALSMWE